MSETESKKRIVGCIVGGAIGDAMGTPYEGMPGPVAYNENIPWRLSDDTQLTLATCEAITSTGRVDPEALAQRFVAWYVNHRITGVGASTLKALRDLADGVPWTMAGRSGEYAAGNGAAMRVAPVALALDIQEPSSRQLLRDVCRITHNNDEAYTGALAIAVSIRRAFLSQWTPGENLLSEVAEILPDTAVRDRVLSFASLDPNEDMPDVAKRYGVSGYVVESVPMALLAVERHASSGFTSVLHSCIRIGGDTDTIASMAGQVLGASLGMSELPPKWVERLPTASQIVRVAEQFARTLLHDA